MVGVTSGLKMQILIENSLLTNKLESSRLK